MSIKPVTIEMIKIVALALEEMNDRAVFVGGATVPFYLPAAFLPQARPTGKTRQHSETRVLLTTRVKVRQFVGGFIVTSRLIL